jgi:T4 RnlA family RNA ligase
MFKLDSYRAAIAHKTEIRESNRGTYTVFDYVVALKDTFDSLEAQNARGIAFDNATGEVISLPFEKFHNFGECPGWLESDIDLSKPHDILEKLDGSCIRTVPDSSEVGFHLGTRAGITDVSKAAEKLLFEDMTPELRQSYVDFIRRFVKDGFTIVFEYVAPTNRIVLYYDKPQLILTAVRNNLTGIYMLYEFMVERANMYGIPVVQRIASQHSSITDLADHVKDLIGSEGVVVRFHDGKMVKMKSIEYVRNHKALDGLRHEKDVLKLIVSGTLDDVLPLVSEEIRDRLVQYRDDVLKNIITYSTQLEQAFSEIPLHIKEDRRAYAIRVTREYERPAFFFQMLDGKSNIVNTFVDKNLNTQTQVDSIRDIIGSKSWYQYGAKINTGDA